MAERLGSAVLELKADQSKLHRGLDQSKAKTEKTTTSMGAAFKKLRTPVGIAVAAIAGVGVAVTKLGGDFEAALSESLAIMGDVSEALRGDMSDAAREVAKATTFSAKEAAESYFFLASAGLSAEQSISALPQVAQFAQAGMFDMARATDLLTDAQSALGLATDDTQQNLANMARISDVLVKANTLANASVSQFSEALTNRAGASLRILNKDVEEGVAVLAAFADQGIKGSMAGEQLSIVIRDLQNASLKNADAFRQAGIAVFDSTGKMRNFGDIIGDLETRLAGLSDEQIRAELTTLGFQDRSVQALLTLVGTSDAIKDYETNLRQAGGTTDQVANKQLDNFNAKLGLFTSKITDVALGYATKLTPAIEDFIVGPGTAFLEWLDVSNREADQLLAYIRDMQAASGEAAAEAEPAQRSATQLLKDQIGLLAELETGTGRFGVTSAQMWADLGINVGAYTEQQLDDLHTIDEAHRRSGKGRTEFKDLLVAAYEDMIKKQVEQSGVVSRASEEFLEGATKQELALIGMRKAVISTDDEFESWAGRIGEITTDLYGMQEAIQLSSKDKDKEIDRIRNLRTQYANYTTQLPDAITQTENLIPPTQQLADDFNTLGNEAADAAPKLHALRDAKDALGATRLAKQSLDLDPLQQGADESGSAYTLAAWRDEAIARQAAADELAKPGRGGGGPSQSSLDAEAERTAELERLKQIHNEYGAIALVIDQEVQTAQARVNEAQEDSFHLAVAVADAEKAQETAADDLEIAQNLVADARSENFDLSEAILEADKASVEVATELKPVLEDIAVVHAEIAREVERQEEIEERLKAAQKALTTARRNDFYLARRVTAARRELEAVERSISAATKPFTDQEALLSGQLRQMDIAETQQKIAATTGREQIEAQLRLAQLNIADIRAKRAGDVESARRRIEEAQAAHRTELARRARVVADRQAELVAARDRVTDAKALLVEETRRLDTIVKSRTTEKKLADAAVVSAETALETERTNRAEALANAERDFKLLDLELQRKENERKAEEAGNKKTLAYLRKKYEIEADIARLKGLPVKPIDMSLFEAPTGLDTASLADRAANLGVSSRAQELLDNLLSPVAMAAGGLATSPTLAMIGEAGPEAVIPLGRVGGMGVTVVNRGTIVHEQEFVDLVVKAQNTARRQGRLN